MMNSVVIAIIGVIIGIVSTAISVLTSKVRKAEKKAEQAEARAETEEKNKTVARRAVEIVKDIAQKNNDIDTETEKRIEENNYTDFIDNWNSR